MNNHDPGTHNASLLGAIFDTIKGDKTGAQSSNAWGRLTRATLRLLFIGFLMASPFIILILLVVLFG
jgi:flagellar biosynthesis protein FliR